MGDVPRMLRRALNRADVNNNGETMSGDTGQPIEMAPPLPVGVHFGFVRDDDGQAQLLTLAVVNLHGNFAFSLDRGTAENFVKALQRGIAELPSALTIATAMPDDPSHGPRRN